MIGVKTGFITIICITCLSLPAVAGVVHKWVDANGVTHYSDAPPPKAETAVTQIEVEARSPVDNKGDYYSITNQWARMNRERIEREKIKLEQARLKAAQQPARTEVVYVEQPPEDTRYIGVYHVPRHLKRGHYRSHYKRGRHRHYARHKPRHSRMRNTRASLGSFKYVH
ncbi:MAG: DUF4124 domain-containing protein [Gammaproteobacteria bacterium]|nr:MAG: DUF4124 domain-containing protein [Gammaproteobacteria bacterium]UCH41426.1 MAG: DUF4124 domain-containing protein [Gammaproteobacteria bacterium]